MATAYIGIGANLGPREETLRGAVARLGASSEVCVRAASSVYETAPVGVTDQPAFLNAVLRVETGFSPRALLDFLLEVERTFGRVREKKWGPRILDLDVLLYDAEVIQEEGLLVPHPYLHERAFVLVPLCELAPEGRHPVLNQTFCALARALRPGQAAERVEGLSLLSQGGCVAGQISCH